MKKIILFGALALAITSCKKDNPEVDSLALTEQKCKISEISFNNHGKCIYEYNISGQLSKIIEYDSLGAIENQETYTYSSGQVISNWITLNFTSTKIHFLNTNGYVSKMIYEDNYGKDTSQYEYTIDGYLSKIISNYSTTIYEYSGGNKIKETRNISNSGTSYIQHYEYYAERLNVSKGFENPAPFGKVNKNLCKKSYSASFSTEFTYDVDGKGYKTKATSVISEVGETPRTYISNYLYKCE